MTLKVEEKRYESKYSQEGFQFPIHCLNLSVKKHNREVLYPHYHEYIEILYNVEGDCDVFTNEKVHTFKTGDLLIINSGESHDIMFERSDTNYIVIKVLPEILYSSEQPVFEMKYTIPFLIENLENKRHFTREELENDYIGDTIKHIMEEWQTRDYGFELAMRADILKVFLWVLRYWHKNNLEAVSQFDYSDETLHIIQQSLEYIAKNYATLTEAEVAEHCNLSYSYFSRMFKKVMNKSFSEYLSDYRITKAEQLLSSTDKSVSEIAEAVGFSTPSYFIHQFKAKKNISPKQYRMKYIK